MTTIACTKTGIACDRQATHGGGMIFTLDSKVMKIPVGNEFLEEGGWIGFAGAVCYAVPAVNWIVDPSGKAPRAKNCEFLVLSNSGDIYYLDEPTNWMKVGEPYFAIGSGMHYAAAAMASGKTELEAVKIASKFDPNTGRGFKHYTL